MLLMQSKETQMESEAYIKNGGIYHKISVNEQLTHALSKNVDEVPTLPLESKVARLSIESYQS